MQYVTLPNSSAPYLRGFEKLQTIKVGETRKATFELRRKDLSEWDVVRQMWVIPQGRITIAVGSSATKIHLVRHCRLGHLLISCLFFPRQRRGPSEEWWMIRCTIDWKVNIL